MRKFESNGIAFEQDMDTFEVWVLGSERYSIDPETLVCTCKAYKYRKDESKPCKHGAALALVDVEKIYTREESAAEATECGIALED